MKRELGLFGIMVTHSISSLALQVGTRIRLQHVQDDILPVGPVRGRRQVTVKYYSVCIVVIIIVCDYKRAGIGDLWFDDVCGRV